MHVLIKDVIVGKRFREKFEGIEELAASIDKLGLIHPITIDENNNLVAGERRLRACQMLKWEKIECQYRKDLSDIEKREIEIEENLYRKDFTWQEEVTAKKKLHDLKQEIHGAATKRFEKADSWGMRDTAIAMGESLGTVAMDIQLARGIKAFPELMKEKSKTVAYKKMKQLQEKILNEELAKRLQVQNIITSPDVIHGDCIEEMMKMPAESVDLILTDPPYGINIGDAQTFGRQREVRDYQDGEFEVFNMLDKAIKEMYRILRPNRHMYMFFGIDKYQALKALLEKYGFVVHQMPIIWDKGSGSYPSQSTTFVHSYEPFFHVMKGNRKLDGTPRDVFQVKRVPGTEKSHISEKPTELLRTLINLSTLPGELVLDPFAGSGSTLVAARECSRRGMGIEKDVVFYQNICARLNTKEEPATTE